MTPRNGITADMLGILQQPTPLERIHTRQGPGGRQLSYVTARFVMDRLDEIGAENWQDAYQDRVDGSVRGGIGILVEGEWVWKWDVGTESDIESEKGVHSDAFKRAGVKWGIARDLYDGGASTPRLPAPVERARAPERAPLRPVASTVPPEPDWMNESPNGHTRPQNGSVAVAAERMTMRELFSAAENQGIPKQAIGDAAKKLYGKPLIKELDDEQRFVVWQELTR